MTRIPLPSAPQEVHALLLELQELRLREAQHKREWKAVNQEVRALSSNLQTLLQGGALPLPLAPAAVPTGTPAPAAGPGELHVYESPPSLRVPIAAAAAAASPLLSSVARSLRKIDASCRAQQGHRPGDLEDGAEQEQGLPSPVPFGPPSPASPSFGRALMMLSTPASVPATGQPAGRVEEAEVSSSSASPPQATVAAAPAASPQQQEKQEEEGQQQQQQEEREQQEEELHSGESATPPGVTASSPLLLPAALAPSPAAQLPSHLFRPVGSVQRPQPRRERDLPSPRLLPAASPTPRPTSPSPLRRPGAPAAVPAAAATPQETPALLSAPFTGVISGGLRELAATLEQLAAGGSGKAAVDREGQQQRRRRANEGELTPVRSGRAALLESADALACIDGWTPMR